MYGRRRYCDCGISDNVDFIEVIMAKKSNDIIELKEQLKESRLQKLYLFYGDEEFLKEHYIKKIEGMVDDCGLEEFNRIRIEGTSDYSVYDDAFEGMPMMTDKRTLLVRDSNIFTTRRSGSIVPPTDSQKAFWEDKFSRLSDDTVVIFCEKNVDARSALFKTAKKVGFAVNCEFMPENELASFAVRDAAKANKKMDMSVAQYFVSVIEPGLNNLNRELDKLINFCGDVIYKSDVDRVVSKAMSVQIFDIIDGITEKNAEKIFAVINNLKTQKESPFGILYLIYSNVEKMLKLKLAGVSSRNAAVSVLGGSPWLAGKYFDSSRKFDTDTLIQMTVRVPEIDYEIKQGLVSEWQALETYIFNAIK